MLKLYIIANLKRILPEPLGWNLRPHDPALPLTSLCRPLVMMKTVARITAAARSTVLNATSPTHRGFTPLQTQNTRNRTTWVTFTPTLSHRATRSKLYSSASCVLIQFPRRTKHTIKTQI